MSSAVRFHRFSMNTTVVVRGSAAKAGSIAHR